MRCMERVCIRSVHSYHFHCYPDINITFCKVYGESVFSLLSVYATFTFELPSSECHFNLFCHLRFFVCSTVGPWC
jgi:hypothetical protein